MMKRTATTLLSITLLITLGACRGEEGLPGPPGNANVRSVELVFSTDDADINGPVASAQFTVAAINESVVEDGAVIAFFREQGTWTAMPYTFGIESQEIEAVDFTISLGFAYELGFLEIFYEASTDEVDLRQQPDRTIKAVIIEGTPFAKANVDLRDYEAVKHYFGLRD